MKPKIFVSLLVSTAIIGFSGCATDQGEKPQEQAKDTRPVDERLKVGMTKDEVIQAIGNPKGKSVNSDGSESWTYNDTENAFIPFYSLSGGKFHNTVVIFDTNGKVKSWSSNTTGAY